MSLRVAASRRSWTQRQPSYKTKLPSHLSSAHKVLFWPSIKELVRNRDNPTTNDLDSIQSMGTSWFIRQQIARSNTALSSVVRLQACALENSIETTQSTQAYFTTFNLISPILDEDNFLNGPMMEVTRDGLKDGDSGSIVVLLVLALGQLAIHGIFAQPISVNEGRVSGFRGGAVGNPPGLKYFNEARKRIGFVALSSNFENVQINLLQAAYFEFTAQHSQFWRSIMEATSVCRLLMKCETIDWETARGDVIKRIYWSCTMHEDFFHFELDLPESGLNAIEDQVPLPYSLISHGDASSGSFDLQLDSKYQFLAMIALRKITVRIHTAVHEYEVSATEGFAGIPTWPMSMLPVLEELSHQLDVWRAMLPSSLKWSDDGGFKTRAGFKALHLIDPSLIESRQLTPVDTKHSSDILTARLRAAFYYARYTIHRPYIFKVLHEPTMVTLEDGKFCAVAIKSACLWPFALSPVEDKKRLIPHLFAWTQSFASLVLILRLTTEQGRFKDICEEYIERDEIDRTIAHMLSWLRDAKDVDDMAAWSWSLLEPLFI